MAQTAQEMALAHFREHLPEWLRSGHEGQVVVYGPAGQVSVFAASEDKAREMCSGYTIYVFKVEYPGAKAATG